MRFIMLLVVGSLCLVACNDDVKKSGAKGTAADGGSAGTGGGSGAEDGGGTMADSGGGATMDASGGGNADGGEAVSDAGGGDAGTAVVITKTEASGKVDGMALTAADAVHKIKKANDNEQQMGLIVASAGSDPLCDVVQGKAGIPSGAHSLAFEIKAVHAGGAAATWHPGSFSMTTGQTYPDGTTIGIEKVTLTRYGSGGATTFEEEATEAKATIASFSDTEVTGTFELTFPSGGPVTGSFVAPACSW